jgi:flavin reductase (DIM6/NTAB) family NADH-FMN oxidoreductase RutF
MSDLVQEAIDRALRRVASGLFVLTAEHDDMDIRMGRLVSRVQRVCDSPPMVSVAVGKGWPIMPLISESRHFGLCQVGMGDRVMRRKFDEDSVVSNDPFLGLDMIASSLPRVPLLAQSIAYLECVIVCHMDVEGDHDLFVGEVKAAGCYGGVPFIHPWEDIIEPPPEAAAPDDA